MFASVRNAFHRVVPSNFHNPVGLAWRLVKTRDRAAWWAMTGAALGLAALPFDWMLSPIERRRIRNATAGSQPLIFVCGPPRSGTTVTAQTLIHNLPVSYFDNLMSTFPRAPLTARRLFRRWVQPLNSTGSSSTTLTPEERYHSYYGKSTRWAGPNDSLFLWDRWVGNDRHRVPSQLQPGAARKMTQFFDACEELSQAPLLNKCNNLNTFAQLVSAEIPRARFICLQRDPLFLAQSLLKARWDIHGDEHVPYGLTGTQGDAGQSSSQVNVYADICAQVRFHEKTALLQQATVGSDKFWIVPYEEFCARPADLVQRVRQEILHLPVDENLQIEPFTVSNKIRIDSEHIERLQQELARTHATADGQRSSGQG